MSNNSTPAFSIGTIFETYIIMAVIAAIIAVITILIHQTTYTPFIVLAALMSGVTAFSAQYASTGNVPGTPIPWHSLIIWVVAAVLVTVEFFGQQTQWTPDTIGVAFVYFLTTLLHEIQTGTPAATSTTTAPPTAVPGTPVAAPTA